MPTISVIVPCYNQAQYLDECLQSVLDQTHKDWECIIVNDGSPDNTEEIAKKWTEKDHRFKYLYKENGGLSSARNAGIEIAEGEWILPLDSDDKIGNLFLELASQQFNNNYKLIYSNTKFFGEKQGEWKLSEFSLPTLAAYNILTCSCFFKKSDWRKIGGYDENFIYGLEDYDFWISLLKNGGNVYKIPKSLFFYRIKKNSMITGMIKDNKTKMFNLLSIKHVAFFTEHLGNFYTLHSKNKQLENEFNHYKNSRRLKIIDAFFAPIDWFLKKLK